VNLEIIYKMSQVVEQGIMHVVGGRIMIDKKYIGHDISEDCIHQKQLLHYYTINTRS